MPRPKRDATLHKFSYANGRFPRPMPLEHWSHRSNGACSLERPWWNVAVSDPCQPYEQQSVVAESGHSSAFGNFSSGWGADLVPLSRSERSAPDPIVAAAAPLKRPAGEPLWPDESVPFPFECAWPRRALHRRDAKPFRGRATLRWTRRYR